MTELHGTCHCGNLSVTFKTSRPLEQLPVRACQCDFCRKHGVRTTTDPNGALEIRSEKAGEVGRYSFGLHAAEFLVCKTCGVYVAAVLERADRCVATLNTNVLDGTPFAERAADPIDYSPEVAEARVARRLRQWTPTEYSAGGRLK